MTAAGINCGDSGRSDCDEQFSSPSKISLQATESDGYQFVGWTGSCSGDAASTSLTVDGSETCVAVFTPQGSNHTAGDPLLGQSSLLIDNFEGPSAQKRTVWLGAYGIDDVSVGPFPDQRRFAMLSFGSDHVTASVTFASPLYVLAPGDYEDAVSVRSDVFPTFDITGCTETAARFHIYEVTFGAGNQITTFAADFEAFCDSSTRIVGAVRFNSIRHRILPFDGTYPIFKLIIEASEYGLVTGPGIDCGTPGHTDCEETFATATTVLLKAEPRPGKFVGWSGACDGFWTTTVRVDWVRRCTPVFSFTAPERVHHAYARWAALLIDSQTGDPIGEGRRHIWLADDVRAEALSRQRIQATVARPDGIVWSLDFRAPVGQELRLGLYENAVDPSASGAGAALPGFSVTSRSGSCRGGSPARFAIQEISFSSDPGSLYVLSLAADFELRCTPGGPLLKGSLRYHSRRNVLTPFAPDRFTLPPTPIRGDLNRDGSPDLLWRHSLGGYNAVWLMTGVNASLTTFLGPSYAERVPDLNWEIRALADLNSDGSPDAIWQHSLTGHIAVWFLSGATSIGTNYIYTANGTNAVEPDVNWKIVAAGDLDYDGHVDLFWRHRLSGEMRLWHMDGIRQWDSTPWGTLNDTGWEIVALADMNGSGTPDLVWRHSGTGKLASWFLGPFDSATLWLSPSDSPDLNWHVVGVADLNRDGWGDVVWQNVVTGELGVWFMNGITMIGGQYLNPVAVSDPNWRIVGVK